MKAKSQEDQQFCSLNFGDVMWKPPIHYLSRVKYIITGGPVVYIMALNKTRQKNKNKNPSDPDNY